MNPRVIDVNKPRGLLRYVRYLSARACPQCGAVLRYVFGDPLEDGTHVELSCPDCDAAPVDAFIIPCVGNDRNTILENFHAEMEAQADVTLKVKESACGRVEGIRLAPRAV